MFPIYLEIGLAIFLVLFLFTNRPEKNESIFGIYRLNTGRFYYWKYSVAKLILKIRKLLKFSKRSEGLVELSEKNNKQNFTLNGASIDKQTLIIENNFKTILRVPEFCNEILVSDPDCFHMLTENCDENKNIYQQNGTLAFQGSMRKTNSSDLKSYNVKISASWYIILPKFNFYWDMNDESFANSISKELWSKEYFENFYLFNFAEFSGQFGEIKGNAEIDGKKFDLFLNFTKNSLNGDESLKRIVHRFVLHIITLETGERFCVGVASFTQQFSRVAIGWVSFNCNNYPVESCDLILHRNGEGGENPPNVYSFVTKIENNFYNTIVRTKKDLRFQIKEKSCRKIIDPNCNFKVNGKEGWGSVIWYYRE